MLNECIMWIYCDVYYDVNWALPIYYVYFDMIYFIIQAPVTRSALWCFMLLSSSAVIVLLFTEFHRITWFDCVQILSFYNILCSFYDCYFFVDTRQFGWFIIFGSISFSQRQQNDWNKQTIRGRYNTHAKNETKWLKLVTNGGCMKRKSTQTNG